MYHKRFLKHLLVVLALALWAGTAFGQTTLTATPSSWAFTYTEFSVVQTKAIDYSVTDSGDSTAHAFAAPTNLPPWLSVDTCGGATTITYPSTVTCTFSLIKTYIDTTATNLGPSTVNPSADTILDTSSAVDFSLTYTSANPTLSVPGGATPTLVIPAYTQGGSATSNTLVVSSNNDSGANTTYTNTPSGCGWLIVTSLHALAATSTTADTLTFTVDQTAADLGSTGAQAGCTVVLAGPAGTFATVTVTLTVNPPLPALNVIAPITLTQYHVGTETPITTTITPTANQAGVAYTVASNQAWLTGTLSGTANTTGTGTALTFTVNTALADALAPSLTLRTATLTFTVTSTSVTSTVIVTLPVIASTLTIPATQTSASYKVGTETVVTGTANITSNIDGVTFTAASSQTWLTVSTLPSGIANTGGTGATVLTYTIVPAQVDLLTPSLTANTAVVTLTIGSSAVTTTLTITVPVVASLLTAVQSTLPMSYTMGSNTAVSGTTTLTSNNDGVNFVATVMGGASAWLTVTASGVANTASFAATTISYSVTGANAEAQGSGPHAATVNFYVLNKPGTIAATVTVTLTGAPASSLIVGTPTLTFANYLRGGTAPAVKTSSVTTLSVPSVNYTLGSTPALPGWLTCVTTSNAGSTGTVSLAAPDVLTCNVNTGSANQLNAGLQTFPVHLQVAGDADVIVTVNLTVKTTVSPLSSNPTAITLTYLIGGGVNQSTLTKPAVISSTDLKYDSYTVVPTTSFPTWFSATPTNNRAMNGSTDSIAFKAAGASVPTPTVPGTYPVGVLLHIDSSNADLPIVVTLNVVGQSMISTPPTVSLSYIKPVGSGSGSGTSSVITSVSVLGITNAPFTLDASTVPTWLTVTPASLTALPGGINVTFATVPAIVQGMSAGNYSSTVALINSLYPGVALSIPVNLSVSNAAASAGLKEGTTTINSTFAKGSNPPQPSWTPYSSNEPIPFTAACVLTTTETYSQVPTTCVLSSTSGVAYTLGYPITATLDSALFNGFGATYGNTVTVTVTVTPTTGQAASTLSYVYKLQPVAPTITSISPAYVAIPTAANSTQSISLLVTGNNFVAPADIYNNGITETQVWLGTGASAIAASNYVVLNNHTQMMITIPLANLASLPMITGKTYATYAIGLANQTTVVPVAATATTNLTVTQAPVVYAITSTASYAMPSLGSNPGVSAYDLISIFGDQFMGLPPLTVTSATAGVSNATIANPLVGNKVQTGLMIGGTLSKPANLTVNFKVGSTTYAAPILYANQNQINAIVPSGMTIGATANVTVTSSTTANVSAAFPVTVMAADPGIFTLSSDGSGQGAIVNYTTNGAFDGSINGSGHPATVGDTVLMYVTGMGAPDSIGQDVASGNSGTFSSGCVAVSIPTGTKNGYMQIVNAPPASTGVTAAKPAWTTVDGAVIDYRLLLGTSSAPCVTDLVTVTFGTGPTAVTATTTPTGGIGWAGWAAGSIAGLLQLNVVIPPNAGAGAVPIQVTIATPGSGSISSPANNATIYLH